MDYFSFFPELPFTIPNDEQTTALMQNIFKSLVIPDEIKTNPNVTFNWTNSIVLTPDEVSIRLYDTPKYWWVILHLNNIDNMATKWPVVEDVLKEWVMRTYHWLDPKTAISYYTTPDKVVVDLRAMKILAGVADTENDSYVIDLYNLKAITIMENYIAKNDSLKNLTLIHPDYIGIYDNALAIVKED